MYEWFSLDAYRVGTRKIVGIFSPAMSPRMFFLDFYVYPPIILLCLIVAFERVEANRVVGLICLVLLGYSVWTLIEYLVHRFVLHHVPLLRGPHEAHHDAPNDLIGTPTILSVAAFYFFGYLPMTMIWGARPTAALLAGLVGGYLSYMLVHYAVHHIGSRGFHFLKQLKRHHALHHHVAGNSRASGGRLNLGSSQISGEMIQGLQDVFSHAASFVDRPAPPSC